MSEEDWKNYMEILHWNTQLASEHYMKVLLDLIEKQQIELNSLKEIDYKYNKALEDLVKLEKERQADKEKIKELEEEIDDMKALFEIQASIVKELNFDTDKKMIRFKDTYYVPDTMKITANIGEPKRIDLSYIEAIKFFY